MSPRNWWGRQRPLVGLQGIEKVLRRHAALHGPESELVVAVIGRAIVDCACCERPVRASAREFLSGRALPFWCGLIALNPEFVREVARQSGYLVSDGPAARPPAPACLHPHETEETVDA